MTAGCTSAEAVVPVAPLPKQVISDEGSQTPTARNAPISKGPAVASKKKLSSGIRLIAADSLGTWFIACMASRESRTNVLILQSSHLPPVAIQRVLASRSGVSAAVVEQDGEAVLYDSGIQGSRPLTNAWFPGPHHEHHHTQVDVSPDGSKIAYLKQQNGHRWLAIMTVATGKEVLLDVEADRVRTLSFEPESQYLKLQRFSQNQRTPVRQSPAPQRGGCEAPDHYRVPKASHPVDTSYLHLATQRMFGGSQIVGTVGDRIFVRDDAEELTLKSAFGGGVITVTGQDCSGRVIHAHPVTGSVVVGCGKRRSRRQVYFRSPAQRLDLGFDLAPFDLDARQPTQATSLPLLPRNKSVLINLFNGTVTQLPKGTTILGSFSESQTTTHLAQRKYNLYFVDETGAETRIRSRPRLARLRRLLPYIAVERDLFNLSNRSFAGQFVRRPLALSLDGRGLIPARYDNRGVAQKPLRWVRPNPLDTP